MNTKCDYEILHLSDYDLEEIKFPKHDDFAESCCFQDNKMYIAVNNEQNSTLYEYDLETNEFVVLRLFKSSVILGSCLQKDKLILADTRNQTIIHYDIKTHVVNRFCINAYPNDLCFGDNNYIYTVGNINYKSKNGIVHKINTDTGDISVVLNNLYSGSGINYKNNKLYIATIVNVVCHDDETNETTELICNTVDYPMYDNITMADDDLCISIFDKDKKLDYKVIQNNFIRTIGIFLMSCTLGVAYYNIHNPNRKSNKQKISFIKHNTVSDNTKYITFDQPINDFDSTVTCVNYYNGCYYLVNWKTNYMIKLTPKNTNATKT